MNDLFICLLSWLFMIFSGVSSNTEVKKNVNTLSIQLLKNPTFTSIEFHRENHCCTIPIFVAMDTPGISMCFPSLQLYQVVTLFPFWIINPKRQKLSTISCQYLNCQFYTGCCIVIINLVFFIFHLNFIVFLGAP